MMACVPFTPPYTFFSRRNNLTVNRGAFFWFNQYADSQLLTMDKF